MSYNCYSENKKRQYCRKRHYGVDMRSLIASLVLTQYRENYGAHCWDGTGECPQHWKNKFGSEYMVKDAPSLVDAEHFVNEYICDKNDYSDEFVVNAVDCDIMYDKVVPEYQEVVVIDWDSRFDCKYIKESMKENANVA